MRALTALVLLLFATLNANLAHAQTAREDQRAPFTNIRFQPTGIEIEVAGTWYRWLALDGIPIASIEQAAHAVGDHRWQKRISEDLTRVLAALGHQHGATVTLRVEPLDGGEAFDLHNVPMTWENRETTRKRRVEAERAQQALPFMPQAALLELAVIIEQNHAYARFKGHDLRKLAEAELLRIGQNATLSETILAAQRIVARLGDGHAGIHDWLDVVPDGRLDFLLQHAKGGVVAFRRGPDATQGEFLAAGFPYVVSMDGLPIERWLEAAARYIPDGSKSLITRRSAETIRYVNLVRDQLGLPHAKEIELVLRNDAGKTHTMRVPVTSHRAYFGIWPRISPEHLERGFEIKLIEPDIVYVRITFMGDEAQAAALLEELTPHLTARGMIIDVRGNGGGDRALLRALLPLVMREPARVVNVAARRLPRDLPMPRDGWLADRYSWPADWHGWSDAERAAIKATIANFKPEWNLPAGEFSDWHFMVVSKPDQSPTFTGPVVILMDGGCFSATDIFLGGFRGVPGVTLMGTPSAGGSARSERFHLTVLNRPVRLGTMASFQPDGKLYDTNGVEPDITTEPSADDLIGKGDSTLEAAISHIKSTK